jgi:aromatic ring-opening dioxygenase catalytic subunit (LigB family)
LLLFVALGAAGDGTAVERVVDGYKAGALAMDSYRFDPR